MLLLSHCTCLGVNFNPRNRKVDAEDVGDNTWKVKIIRNEIAPNSAVRRSLRYASIARLLLNVITGYQFPFSISAQRVEIELRR